MPNFGIFPFTYLLIAYLLYLLKLIVGTSVTEERWIIFEIDNDLKTTILPSIANILNFRNFKMFYFEKSKYLEPLNPLRHPLNR